MSYEQREDAVLRGNDDHEKLIALCEVGFAHCISGPSHTKNLRRHWNFLRVALPMPTRQSAIARRQGVSQPCRLGVSRSRYPSITLAGSTQTVLQLVEDDFSSDVREFLEKEFEGGAMQLLEWPRPGFGCNLLQCSRLAVYCRRGAITDGWSRVVTQAHVYSCFLWISLTRCTVISGDVRFKCDSSCMMFLYHEGLFERKQ